MKQAREYQIAAATALYESILDDPACHPIAALPTGSGKTMVLNEFIDLYLTHNFAGNVLILSHVKEILEQDYKSLVDFFEGFDIGLYSAGLDSRTTSKITVAGIQSVFRQPENFRKFNVVLIDECHLINAKDAGMYRSFLAELDANYVGLTATPFRMSSGYIYEGKTALFNRLAFDLCTVEGYRYLIEQGYLCRLIAKGTNTQLDTSDLTIRMGDYVESEMSEAFDRDEITELIADEIIEYGENYKKWLVFAIDIEHAEHITQALNDRNIPTVCVHSEMDEDRSEQIAKFKTGSYRALVNVNILTTGFDDPEIDLIAMVRPTESPVLHVQTLGRGMRVSPGKEHCLVLDFAGNVERLGAINDLYIKTQSDKKKRGEIGPPVKKCPECFGYVHIKESVCPYCGHKFPSKLRVAPTEKEIIKLDPVIKAPQWLKVDRVYYYIHKKEGKPDSMRVTYQCGLTSFSEYVCFEHEGYAGHKAYNWVQFRVAGKYMPLNTQDLVSFGRDGMLLEPTQIKVNVNSKFPVIENVRFEKGAA